MIEADQEFDLGPLAAAFGLLPEQQEQRTVAESSVKKVVRYDGSIWYRATYYDSRGDGGESESETFIEALECLERLAPS